MNAILPLALDGVFEILPTRHLDARGFLSETWSEAAFARADFAAIWVKDLHVHSHVRGTLRGLHYQLPPRAQDKLVRVVRGSIFDVAVDLRRSSPTFGGWTSRVVSAEKWNQVFIPKGFAHGYLTLEPQTDVIYKVSDEYSPHHERAIRFDDPAIGIEWPSRRGPVVISDKDRDGAFLARSEVFD
jgi:dTDP-4-dehydrorhamnose 3,5-epimerase